jgi:ribonuclease P protein component
MVIVTDPSDVMTAERLRESAFKIFRKMEWRTDAAGVPDVEG